MRMPTNPEDLTTLAYVLIVAVIVLVFVLIFALQEIGVRAQRRFEQWKARELEGAKQDQNRALAAEYEVKNLQWRAAYEANIRQDAIIRSTAVIKGRVSEHLAPYINFPYNPRDARFIGSPIDMIVFNGLEDGVMREIVFLEIKTGEAASLSVKQRQIRDAIRDKRVVWLEFRI